MSSKVLAVMAPFFRYSLTRDAYVLRGVGQRFGPVLRVERRVRAGAKRNRAGAGGYGGPERRRLATGRG